MTNMRNPAIPEILPILIIWFFHKYKEFESIIEIIFSILHFKAKKIISNESSFCHRATNNRRETRN